MFGHLVFSLLSLLLMDVYHIQVWPMLRCCTKWNMDTVCLHLQAVHQPSMISWWNAGTRTQWRDQLLKHWLGSWRISSPLRGRSTKKPLWLTDPQLWSLDPGAATIWNFIQHLHSDDDRSSLLRIIAVDIYQCKNVWVKRMLCVKASDQEGQQLCFTLHYMQRVIYIAERKKKADMKHMDFITKKDFGMDSPILEFKLWMNLWQTFWWMCKSHKSLLTLFNVFKVIIPLPLNWNDFWNGINWETIDFFYTSVLICMTFGWTKWLGNNVTKHFMNARKTYYCQGI